VVELGCNDGILLENIAKDKARTMGIEPAKNAAQLARNKGIKIIADFFDYQLAKKIKGEHGWAEIIVGSNTISHIEDLNSVFKGVEELLKNNGWFIFEDPYIHDIVKKCSFDQIYDEHIYYFCGLNIKKLAEKHNFQLIDMVWQDVHGGSMRYYLKKGSENKINSKVSSFIAKEKKANLDKTAGFKNFYSQTNKIIAHLKKLLIRLKKQGKEVVGYGAASKSTILLNLAKIDSTLLDYIVDNSPTKIGKFTPMTKIPIKDEESFRKDHPDYALLLAWNHKEEIFEKEWRYRQRGGKFILYNPKIEII
jgi:methylation protein EvaC